MAQLLTETPSAASRASRGAALIAQEVSGGADAHHEQLIGAGQCDRRPCGTCQAIAQAATIKNNGNGQGDRTGVRNRQARVLRHSLA